MPTIWQKFWLLRRTSIEERRQGVREELTFGDAFIDGSQYPMRNWSATGYCIGPTTFEPRIGSRYQTTFRLPLAGGELEFECQILVVRVDADSGVIAGKFQKIDPKTRQIIDDHFNVLTREVFQAEAKDWLHTLLIRWGLRNKN